MRPLLIEENSLISSIFDLSQRRLSHRTFKYASKVLLAPHRNWPEIKKFSSATATLTDRESLPEILRSGKMGARRLQ